jgi:hypothetical protein
MRLLELFAGTGSVGKAFQEYGWEVVGLDITRGHAIQSDVLHWDYTIFPRNHFDCIHASPPCTQYSICRTSAKTPRDLVGADALVQRTLDIIEYFQPKVFIIENPIHRPNEAPAPYGPTATLYANSLLLPIWPAVSQGHLHMDESKVVSQTHVHKKRPL